MLNRMRESLLKLLFPTPTTSASSASSPYFIPATRRISRPIDMIITDLFVLPPIWEAYERNIRSYLFMPNSLMTFMRYINTSRDQVENGGLAVDFDRQMHKTIPLAKGLICNSFLELDKEVLNEFRQQPVPGSNISVLFVAPLISKIHAQKQHV